MAIAFRAAAGNSTQGASCTVTIPATVQPGDAMLLFHVMNSASLAVTTPPTGWDPLEGTQTTASAAYTAWRRVAQAGDAGATVTVGTNGGSALKNTMLVGAWSGVDTTTPVDAFTHALESTSQTAHAAGTVNTTNDNDVIVSVAMGKDTGVTAWTPPGGFTSRVSNFAGGTGQTDGAIADTTTTTHGTGLGGGTWTEDVASTNVCIYTIALAPLSATTSVRPASDVTTTGWTTVPAQAATDSYASRLADGNDLTYASSPTNPNAAVLEVKLGVPPGPLTQITHRGYTSGGATSMTIVTGLYMGTTLIASFTETALVTAPTTFTYTLNASQQAAQTDLTDLRLRVTATVA